MVILLWSHMLFGKATADSAEAPKQPFKFNPEFYVLTNKNAPATLLCNSIFTLPTFAKTPKLTLTGEVYVQRNEAFGEMLVGPSYTSTYFEGGVMVGFQTGRPELRVGPWFTARDKCDRLSAWCYYECGPEWSVRAEATWRISNTTDPLKTKVRTGLKMYEENAGPTLNLEKRKSYISIAPVYGWADKQWHLLASVGWYLSN